MTAILSLTCVRTILLINNAPREIYPAAPFLSLNTCKSGRIVIGNSLPHFFSILTPCGTPGDSLFRASAGDLPPPRRW